MLRFDVLECSHNEVVVVDFKENKHRFQGICPSVIVARFFKQKRQASLDIGAQATYTDKRGSE